MNRNIVIKKIHGLWRLITKVVLLNYYYYCFVVLMEDYLIKYVHRRAFDINIRFVIIFDKLYTQMSAMRWAQATWPINHFDVWRAFCCARCDGVRKLKQAVSSQEGILQFVSFLSRVHFPFASFQRYFLELLLVFITDFIFRVSIPSSFPRVL